MFRIFIWPVRRTRKHRERELIEWWGNGTQQTHTQQSTHEAWNEFRKTIADNGDSKMPHTCNADANNNCQLTQSIIHSSFIIVKCLPIRTSNEQTNGIKLLNCHEFVFGDVAATRVCVCRHSNNRRTSDGMPNKLLAGVSIVFTCSDRLLFTADAWRWFQMHWCYLPCELC